jgi:hypothetical protein
MADMKEIDMYETRERKFINWFINLKPEHKLDEISPIGSFQRNDFIMISGTSYILGEVKIRTFEWDKYDTAVIELDKINALTEIYEPFNRIGKNHNKLFYFAVYPKSRKILIFDILNTPSTITYEWCPITTAKDIGNKFKSMANYQITDAIIKIDY